MAEDAYREYKEDDSALTAIPRRPLRDAVPANRLRIRRAFRPRPSLSEADYTAFKATIASAVEEIKLEMHAQHEQTRAEVQTVRHDVLAAVRASPAEYVKLLCEFSALLLLFCLAVRFTLNIELVNPAFALFLLFACVVYWAMASVKERSEKRGHENSPA